MAYMDDQALEREKSKQAMIAGKTPLLGADTSSMLHALGVNLGVVPPGTPPSQMTQLLEGLVKGPGAKNIHVDEQKPLQVQPLVGRMASLPAARFDGGDDVGAALLGAMPSAKDKALNRLLQQEKNKPPVGGPPAAAPGAPPAPGANRARLSGNTPLAKANDLTGVDPKVAQAAKEWAQVYNSRPDATHTVQFTSGKREGDPREHGRGNAFDMQLIDKSTGKALENYRTNDPKTFAAYQDYANGFHQYLEANHPDLAARHRWGGYFSGDTSKYGSLDQMHHDFAGDRIGMAGGSWKDGLSPQQAKLFPGLNPGGGLAGKPPMAPGRPTLAAPASATSATSATPAAGANGAVSLHAGEHPGMDVLTNKSIPAGERFNNPFNMWHDGYADVHGGKPGIQITQHDTPAVYANKEAGAAAAIQKMAQSPLYSGKTMQDMIGTWVGHGTSYAPKIEEWTGISRNTKITPEFLASPDGMKFLKAMARYETNSSKPYGLTDAQWEKARNVALSNPPALANSIPPRAKPATPAASPPPAPAAAQPASPVAAQPPQAAAPAATASPPAAAQLGPSGEEPLVSEPAAAPAAPAPAVAAPLPPAPAAAAAPAPTPPVAATPAPVAKPAPPAAPAVNPAHAMLDTKIIDLVRKGDPSKVGQIPGFIADKTLREAINMPMVGGRVAAEAKANLAKAGITPQQFDAAVKEGPPKAAPAPGKRSDLGTSDATDFSASKRMAPADPNAATLDPLQQKPVQNEDGSISTVRTIGVEDQGKEVNIPTVPAEGGRVMSNDEAVQRYVETGKHLGKFDTVEQAGAAADKLHQDEAARISEQPKGQQGAMTPEIAKALTDVYKDESRVAPDPSPPPADAMPVLPAQPATPAGGTAGGLPLAPAGLSSIPTGTLAPGAMPSQGGGIAMAGMLPPIENATFSSPLIDQTAARGGAGMGLSPIAPQILQGWGWGGGSGIGAGLDWGGGGGFDFSGGGMPMGGTGGW